LHFVTDFPFILPILLAIKGILLSIVFVLGTEEIMYNLNDNKKKDSAATTMSFLFLGTILVLAGISTPIAATPLLQYVSAQSFIDSESDLRAEPKAPVVVSGDNIYITWWTNNTENGNEEVMFRASNDGGATFGDKINLSNTTEANSWRVEIAGEGADVVVSWWETNQTSDVPVARVSTDGGATFGPLLRLGMNGSISEAEEEGEGAAGEG
jgi:hypothetical protein